MYSYNKFRFLKYLLAILIFLPFSESFSQKVEVDTSYFSGLQYRIIGPYRGGRADAVTGVPGDDMVYYMGATGGGVWKTEDGGQKWKNISDGYFGGAIGSIAVSNWDPNVIYVGTGEETVRGNVSSGNGIWKSVDAGKTWTHAGLDDSRHITRIRIDPKNPDIVYVAVLGHLWGPNEQRGVFKSIDGGKTWKKVLFVSKDAGALDLILDPSNSRILYASTWQVRRTPYGFESGGQGSGLWKSTDEGNTWKEISNNKGIPKETLGIIGVTVSPANHNRVWAIVEAHDGGLFRSDNGGENWIKVNSDRNLRQRAWYYSRIYADPKNEDMVYAVNVRFWVSKDGGKSFESIRTPHGDHHDLWINPNDPNKMIVADDGGAQISVDGGEGWSTYFNQPTAQIYRVATDNHFPYRIYGAQQDNSALRILHRTDGRSIGEGDWESTAGGESGWIVPDPKDNDVVYGGSYGGLIIRINHKTGETRSVDVWPDNPMGHAAKDLKYRFQWNFPLLFSIHDSTTLYAAGNILFKSINAGQSWQAISPDLTRDDTTKLGSSGGPITKDNTSIEYYATIFTVSESPVKAGIIWTGSDDGLIYVTKDGGKTWSNVTPPKDLLPEWAQINSIDGSPYEEGGLYVAATRYKSDDYHPYLLKTTDFGKTWEKITNGIPANQFTRVVRADPNRKGLLYAGTEEGMYISFNDGKNWQPFQLNLPIVPITDLTIKGKDLVVATQGRAFWVLDDLTSLYQLNKNVESEDFYLFTPRPAYRVRGYSSNNTILEGKNLQAGVILDYYFKTTPDSNKVKLEILDNNGNIIGTYKVKTKKRDQQLPMEKGLNRFIWNMHYPQAESFKGMILWAGGTRGPVAVPGNYQARLFVNKDSINVPFKIVKDPRSGASNEDLQKQFDFLLSLRDKLSETNSTVKQIREIKKQLEDVISRIKGQQNADKISKAEKEINKKLTDIEEELYQTKNRSSQDPLNFPIRLNNKLSALGSLVGIGDYKPTDQAYEVKKELTDEIDIQLAKFKEVLDTDIPAFNKLVGQSSIPAVIIMKNNEK